MNFAHFCEFWWFSLGKQARFTLNFCSGMPLRKVHEVTFLWFGLLGPLLTGVPGTSRVCPWDASGASDRQIPLCDFSLSVFFSPYQWIGIIERGVPQAYVRARASSETLRSVHVSRVFLCISISKWEIDTYQNGLGYISDTYPNPYPPLTVPPL